MASGTYLPSGCLHRPRRDQWHRRLPTPPLTPTCSACMSWNSSAMKGNGAVVGTFCLQWQPDWCWQPCCLCLSALLAASDYATLPKHHHPWNALRLRWMALLHLPSNPQRHIHLAATPHHCPPHIHRMHLFNPRCHRGKLLKLKPVYSSSTTPKSSGSASQPPPTSAQLIADAAILRSQDGANLINDTRMPGFPRSNSPGLPGLLPCPPEWGNGQQVGLMG